MFITRHVLEHRHDLPNVMQPSPEHHHQPGIPHRQSQRHRDPLTLPRIQHLIPQHPATKAASTKCPINGYGRSSPSALPHNRPSTTTASRAIANIDPPTPAHTSDIMAPCTESDSTKRWQKLHVSAGEEG